MQKNSIHIFIVFLFMVSLSAIVLDAGGKQYRIQNGDTLSEIAQEYEVPLKAIMQANGIQSVNQIRAGKMLYIPTKAARAIVYRVEPGDTLSEIAQEYEIPLKVIVQSNSIQSVNQIRAGKTLHIPTKALRNILHQVEAGDTLLGIAAKYEVPLDTITHANSIQSANRIQTGKTLHIPTKALLDIPEKVLHDIVYRVKPGDTLSGIAHSHNVQWRHLQKINSIAAPHKLRAGSDIRIPGSNSSGFGKPLRVPLRVTSNYGYRSHPVTGRYCFHHGIDFQAAAGTRVYASKAGRVIFAGQKNGYGKVVGIEHENDFTTWYGHLSRIRVSDGQTVAQGKMIGLSGNTGVSTGPHLHFEIRYKGRSENPTKHLNLP